MADRERANALARARMRRMRQRRLDEAERAAESRQRWAVQLADQLERDRPDVADYLATLPPAVAEALVEELAARRFARAMQRAQR
jgi:folate-dependent phosphoribosylglycinamide formyltransferase PurN